MLRTAEPEIILSYDYNVILQLYNECGDHSLNRRKPGNENIGIVIN